MAEEPTTYSGFKRWSIRILGIVLGLAVLTVAVRLSLKTSFVQGWAKNMIISTANNQLNAELDIENLSGDLWHEVTFAGIALTVEKDTLAAVDSVSASYNIWALADGEVELAGIDIYRPSANIKQQNGRWNVDKIVTDTSSSGGGSTMSLDIADLQLHRGKVSARGSSLPVESPITVAELEISGSISYDQPSYDVDLRNLSFQVQKLTDQPIEMNTSASASDDKITLQKLVLATGNSMIESSGVFKTADSTLKVDFAAKPLGWKDVAQVARQMPLRSDLQLSAGIRGTTKNIELSLQMQGAGIKSFDVRSQFQRKDVIALSQFSIDASRLDLATLLADTAMPRLNNLQAKFTGRVPLQTYQQARGDLKITASGISRGLIQVDRLSANGKINSGTANADITVNSGEQSMSAQLSVDQIWSAWPAVSGEVSGANINPAYWTADTTYAGNISFDASFSGEGWYPQEKAWTYSLSSSNSRFMEQSIRSLSLSGNVNDHKVRADGKVNIGDGLVQFKADAENIFAVPSFNYQLKTHDLNVAALMGRPNFSTAINADLSGRGQGKILGDLRLQSSVSVDSSLVNGELVRSLSAGLSVKDTTAVVDSAQLKSTIAEGSLDARMHLLNYYDPDNELSLDLKFKDIGALAPLVGVEGLSAEGKITGRLRPNRNKSIQFKGNVDLSDTRYGKIFFAEQLKGAVDIKLKSAIDYMVDVDLESPAFYGFDMQNLSFKSQGRYHKPKAKGSFELKFTGSTEGSIEQAGSYNLGPDSVQVTTRKLDMISDYRTLSLQNSFTAKYINDTLSIDTMRVASDQAYMQLAVPIFSDNEQRGSVDVQSLNIEVIQNSLFGKPVVEGLLSGQMSVARKDTALNANGEIILSEMEYKGAGFDTLSIEGKIKNERLDGRLRLRDSGQSLVKGEASLPFRLEDPEELPPAFFDEAVDGELQMKKISIERFEDVFADFGLSQSTGKIALNSSLSGKAGNPKFSVDISLTDGKLSGITVDSVTAGGTYDHDKQSLSLNAAVKMMKQDAADLSAEVPLFIDLKTFEVDLPGQKDSLSAKVSTNNFNLAASNDFLDPKIVQNVKGTLDGDVRITGPVGDLQAKGKLEFQNGGLKLIPAGVTLKDVRSTVLFRPNKIELKSLSASSDNGTLTAEGMVELTEMVPGNINLDVNANNFRAANNEKYNAVINFDSKVRGTLTKPKVTGDLKFISGFVKLDNFGEKSVETITLDSTEVGPDISLYDSLSLDMNISFNKRFNIRNKRYLELEAALDGSVELLKDPGGELQLFGTINTPEGYALPFGKRFELQEGAVTFTGVPNNPNLMIRTRYEPPETKQDVIIWYIIEGTVEEPKFKYESQPSMELENIISYTIFGQPYYALNSWKQAVAGSGGNNAAANVALDVLLDRVEALATRKLGVDVVKIDNTRAGKDNATSITTGWYLNPKVFFAIQNIITGSRPDTSFLLEYQVRENLELLLRQGNGIREGVDIKWNYDY